MLDDATPDEIEQPVEDEVVEEGVGHEPEMAEPEKAPEPEAKESALVQKFQEMVQVPTALQRWYAQFERDRKYVNETSLMLDTVDAVATNYILRNQIVLMSNLYARDPAISWKPAAMIGETPPLLGQYSRTLEIFCRRMGEEIELKRLIRGGIQDASTIGWAIFKLNPQEDPSIDPLGNRRQNDQLDNIARYKWFMRRKADGLIPDDSAAQQEMDDLAKVVAKYLQDTLATELINKPPQQVPLIDPMTGAPIIDPVTGEPMTEQDKQDPRPGRLEQLGQGIIPEDYDVGEIPRFLGFNLDQVQGEDFRFDWTVSATENMYQAGWIAHRVYMDYDLFGSTFNVTPAEIGQIKLYDGTGALIGDKHWSPSLNQFDNEGPSDRQDFEASTNMGRCAVWEMWNRKDGRVYVWAEGMRRFLRNSCPTIVGRRWYPFYFLPFNRVTGRALPLSDTVLTSPLQDELNRRRTQEAEAQAACFPRIFIKRGVLSKDERNALNASAPYEAIELDTPEDVAKAFAETKPLPFNPALYARNDTRMELEMMSGISRNAAGSSSAEGQLATGQAIANEQMGVQVDYRRSLLDEMIFDIMYDLAYMAVQFFPEENIKAICGPNAYWPLLERETFLRQLKLDVRAGSSGRPDAEKNLKVYEMLAGMTQQLGLPLDGEALLEDIMYEMGKPDWKKYLLSPEKQAMRMMMGMPPGGAPAGGMPPGPGQPRGNAAQAAPTPGSGRPTMAETGPPSPESVPGPV